MPAPRVGWIDRQIAKVSPSWTGANRIVRTAYTRPAIPDLEGDPTKPIYKARTNLRDNVPIASRYDGAALYRRLAACQIAIS